MRRFPTPCLLALACLLAVGAEAQEPPTTLIRTSGNGMVELPADYAVLLVGVTARHPRPDSAAQRMGRTLDRIVQSLVDLGVARDSLPTSRLALETRRIGANAPVEYEASTELRLRVWDMDRLPDLLNAAIDGGATDIPHLQFRSLREEEGRDAAIRQATEEANRAAELIAEVQGMSLVRLVSSEFDVPNVGFDRILLRGIAVSTGRSVRGSLVPASIVPVGISFSARVSVEWEARE